MAENNFELAKNFCILRLGANKSVCKEHTKVVCHHFNILSGGEYWRKGDIKHYENEDRRGWGICNRLSSLCVPTPKEATHPPLLLNLRTTSSHTTKAFFIDRQIQKKATKIIYRFNYKISNYLSMGVIPKNLGRSSTLWLIFIRVESGFARFARSPKNIKINHILAFRPSNFQLISLWKNNKFFRCISTQYYSWRIFLLCAMKQCLHFYSGYHENLL